MKLEIGMYVRTINGKIWIIKSQQAISGHRKDIINASYDIIDLIEVGDYVNGSRVEEIEGFNGEKYLYLEEMEYSNANQDYINVYCKQEYIKSLVTKEAFESMEYRIGE